MMDLATAFVLGTSVVMPNQALAQDAGPSTVEHKLIAFDSSTLQLTGENRLAVAGTPTCSQLIPVDPCRFSARLVASTRFLIADPSRYTPTDPCRDLAILNNSTGSSTDVLGPVLTSLAGQGGNAKIIVNRQTNTILSLQPSA
jgi:hypothetical protein